MEMKKSILLLTGSALLLAGCAKVENEVVVPESTMKHVVLKATVNEADTRVSADAAGSFSWQAGDEIAVYTDKSSVAKFTAANGGATADFEGDLPSDAGFGSYAFYPYADNFCAPSADDHIVFTLGGEHNFVQDATNMPMMGAITDEGVTFEAVGGVLKLIVYNIPQGVNEFRFVSTDGKKIAGNFTVTKGAIVTEDAIGAVEDTQKFLFERPESGNMVFYIPLPTGTIGAFKVKFYGEDKNTPVYEKTANANLTVGLNKLIVAPALNAAPAEDVELWSEDFSEYSANAIPKSGIGYNNTAVSYSVTNTGSSLTKVYAENLAGGTSPELLVAKNGGSFTVSNIPTAGASSAVLTFKSNKSTQKVTTSTDDVLITKVEGSSYSYNITIPSTVTSFDLSFVSTGGDNVRIDDIVLTATVGANPTTPSISTQKDNATISAGNLSASIDGVRIMNQLDNQGIVALTEVDWLDLVFEGNQGFEVGKKLKATAKSLWFGDEARVATVTLKATGATKTVTFTQSPSVVNNPTLSAIKGDATFTISWAGVTGAASYVGYYSATELTDPTTGTELTITSGDDGYSAVPSQTVTNGTKYYIYVKVATLDNAHSNYAIAKGWATTDVTPSATIDYSTTYTSNVKLNTTGNEVTSVKVKINQIEYAALKAGTSKKVGKITNLTIPKGSTHLHIHAAGWNGESVTIKITTGTNTTIATKDLTSDSGLQGTSTTFTLEGNLEDYYFDIPLTGMTTDKTFVFEATSGKRFVLWGVNAE